MHSVLKSQADRCREILQKLSQNPLKLKDNFFEKVKITDLIKINFDKFNKNKQLNIIEDKKSGEYKLSHHVDLKSGYYNGKKILDI